MNGHPWVVRAGVSPVTRDVEEAVRRAASVLKGRVACVKPVVFAPLARSNELFVRLASRRTFKGISDLIPADKIRWAQRWMVFSGHIGDVRCVSPAARDPCASPIAATLTAQDMGPGLLEGTEYEKLIQDRDHLVSDMLQAFASNKIDVLLMPPAVSPAVRHRTTVMAHKWYAHQHATCVARVRSAGMRH